MALKDKLLMSCSQATALVEKKRDKKLSFAERLGLWIHMGYCNMCALFFNQSQMIDDLTKAYAAKVTNEQKSYKMNPVKKADLTSAIETEMANPGS
jgi:hypothetical protein